ncbi:MAG: dihydrolipoamide acetyltransferase family protein [Streptosporangiales bacterium]
MALRQFNLPDLGEGLVEGEVVKWLVQPGDEITVNQDLAEIETAKAAVELPSPWAGTVRELHAEEGSTIDVGSPLVTVDVAGAAGEQAAEDGAGAAEAESESTSVLVGYGSKAASGRRRPRKRGQAAPQPAEAAEPAEAEPEEPARPEPEEPQPASQVTVLAKPPVRKLAKDLGVDLRTVTGTGPQGTISRDDVRAQANGAAAPSRLPEAVPASGGVPQLSFGADGTARIPVKGVRKHIASAMVQSAFSAPHVTEFVTVDATATMDLVRRLKQLPEFAEVRVSPLLVVARALLLAVRRNPIVNSAWDEQAQEIVVRGYVNLGIAAATPRGLVVPNVRDADQLSLADLACAVQDLTDTARAGKTAPSAMQGGTITITNVGVFGVDTGTPILNPGEAAILASGAIREQPWVHDGAVVPRMVTTLGLSFDHRIVDGEQGSRFLRDIADFVEEPQTRLFAWT